MASAFTGQLVLVLNGLPIIHLKSIDWECETNREPVVGMNPIGTALGSVDGTKEYSLSLEVYCPKTGDIAWEDINGAIIGAVPRDGGSPNTLFTGFYVQKVGAQFAEKGAAVRKIEGRALTKMEL